jgi:predicted amidohydrolase YtcJ
VSADAQVIAGRLRTLDPQRPLAQAMAIRDGRVLAVGTVDEAVSAAGEGAELVSVPGTVVPGLIDSHVHALIAGLELRRLDVSDSRSVSEIVRRVGDHLRVTNHSSEWLVVAAHVQSEELAEGRLPTRADLDPVTGGRPLYLDRRTHDAIVNTAGLERAGISAATADPPGGVIERDHAGSPTGVLTERPAADLAWRFVEPASEADQLRALREIQPRLHALGLTGIVEPGVSAEELSAYQNLHTDGELRLRTTVMPLADSDHGVESMLASLRGLGAHTGFGDEWLRLGAVKVYVDGTGGFGTALLREPWPPQSGADDPGHDPNYFGTQVMGTETFLALAEFCARERWSLAVHTVGGAAIDLALEVFAVADRVAPIAPLRFSLIHAYLWPSEQNMASARELGVTLAIQPGMQWRVAAGLARRFGAERAGQAHPLRAWLDAGVSVAGGSDGPDFPMDPLFCMWQARTRHVQGIEEPLGPEFAIDGQRALQLYTTGAALYCSEETQRGQLKAGFLADWTALSVDPVTTEAEQLRTATVLQTAIGGDVVHEL